MLRRIDPLQIYADVGGKKLVDAIKFCEKINDRYNRRYLNRRRSSTTWTSNWAGAAGAAARIARLRLDCENGWVELYWAAPNCAARTPAHARRQRFRRQLRHCQKFDLGPVTLDISESEDSSMIRSSSLVCRIHKKPVSAAAGNLPGSAGRLQQISAGIAVGRSWRCAAVDDAGAGRSLLWPGDARRTAESAW